jgi:hypothetical protein
MQIEISMGEAIDRHTILQIKSEFIKDQEKLANVRNELEYLNKLITNDIYFGLVATDDIEELRDVNMKLWKIEDELRIHEKENRFDQYFIDLARAVYYTNDKRAEIKRRINLACGATFIEEKSYVNYKNS